MNRTAEAISGSLTAITSELLRAIRRRGGSRIGPDGGLRPLSIRSRWTTGDFSGQGHGKVTFTLKNTGTITWTASNFPTVGYYFSVSFKRYSTAGSLVTNRANWELSKILFTDVGRTQILPGETITVNAPFNSVDSWYVTGISNQYGMDPAADRYIFAGFRISLQSGSGVKNAEIDDVKLVP